MRIGDRLSGCGWQTKKKNNKKTLSVKTLRNNCVNFEFYLQFLLERVRLYCLKWQYSFDIVLEIYTTFEIQSKPRTSASKPIPLSLGGNGLAIDLDRINDEFVIRRYNDYQSDWKLVCKFPGYRFSHFTLQIDNYLYVIGGCSGTITSPSINYNRMVGQLNGTYILYNGKQNGFILYFLL